MALELGAACRIAAVLLAAGPALFSTAAEEFVNQDGWSSRGPGTVCRMGVWDTTTDGFHSAVVTHAAPTLEDCKRECVQLYRDVCHGVEFGKRTEFKGSHHCEMWTTPVGWYVHQPGYECAVRERPAGGLRSSEDVALAQTTTQEFTGVTSFLHRLRKQDGSRLNRTEYALAEPCIRAYLAARMASSIQDLATWEPGRMAGLVLEAQRCTGHTGGNGTVKPSLTLEAPATTTTPFPGMPDFMAAVYPRGPMYSQIMQNCSRWLRAVDATSLQGVYEYNTSRLEGFLDGCRLRGVGRAKAQHYLLAQARLLAACHVQPHWLILECLLVVVPLVAGVLEIYSALDSFYQPLESQDDQLTARTLMVREPLEPQEEGLPDAADPSSKVWSELESWGRARPYLHAIHLLDVGVLFAMAVEVVLLYNFPWPLFLILLAVADFAVLLVWGRERFTGTRKTLRLSQHAPGAQESHPKGASTAYIKQVVLFKIVQMIVTATLGLPTAVHVSVLPVLAVLPQTRCNASRLRAWFFSTEVLCSVYVLLAKGGDCDVRFFCGGEKESAEKVPEKAPAESEEKKKVQQLVERLGSLEDSQNSLQVSLQDSVTEIKGEANQCACRVEALEKGGLEMKSALLKNEMDLRTLEQDNATSGKKRGLCGRV
mmetsp:Transcript_28017/g.77065  ORF Transcript_28017/g.77065 Transcript_28017/m.77065 type:complete len:653 (-) Transcript_28017:199-2157(-)